MAPAVDLLVLAAHPAELTDVAEPGERFTQAGRSVATASVGVGIGVAGAGTARALARVTPRAALLVGSCGSFAAWPVLTTCVASAARLLDAAQLEGRSAYPEAMATEAVLDASLGDGVASALPDARRAVVGTTPGITTDDALAQRLARSGCDVENLEALAVALACEAAGVPLAALLVVTNRVGSEGRAQWLANHRGAARRSAEQVKHWLDAGAAGFPAC